jgi:anti-sigma factor RsiW
MNEMHLTHEELIDYLHGELTPARDAAAHAHLAACSACSRTYEAEVSLTEVLRRHARSEDRELPPSVVATIREATSQKPSTPAWGMLRGILRPAIAVPMAAAIAAALYFGIDLSHKTSPATSINAAYYVNNHAALTATAPFSEDAPVPAVLTSDDTAAQQQPADAPR